MSVFLLFSLFFLLLCFPFLFSPLFILSLTGECAHNCALVRVCAMHHQGRDSLGGNSRWISGSAFLSTSPTDAAGQWNVSLSNSFFFITNVFSVQSSLQTTFAVYAIISLITSIKIYFTWRFWNCYVLYANASNLTVFSLHRTKNIGLVRTMHIRFIKIFCSWSLKWII